MITVLKNFKSKLHDLGETRNSITDIWGMGQRLLYYEWQVRLDKHFIRLDSLAPLYLKIPPLQVLLSFQKVQ